MPVISSNALVSVFDSYSCVGIVSDSTLISMPRNGVAAFTNHSISCSCCSLVSVEGWNSRSTHRLASSMPASAWAGTRSAIAATATVAIKRLFIAILPKDVFVTRETEPNATYELKRMSIENH